jgi:hypothetical protein
MPMVTIDKLLQHLSGLYLMGVSLIGLHLIGVYLMNVYLIYEPSLHEGHRW